MNSRLGRRGVKKSSLGAAAGAGFLALAALAATGADFGAAAFFSTELTLGFPFALGAGFLVVARLSAIDPVASTL